MPSIDTFYQRPSSGPPHRDVDDAWAMPLGSIAGLRFYLSYSVFVAAAILIGVVAIVATQPGNTGNGDLPKVALIAVCFWVAGWVVQIVTHIFARIRHSVPIESLAIGLLGVETRHRAWGAKDALLVSLATLFALLMVGGSITWAAVMLGDAQTAGRSIGFWNAPSFGLGTADLVWISGGWIFFIQMICQAYPLPRSLGRTAMIASVSLLGSRANEPLQTHFCRRSIQVIALLTSMLALASLLSEQTVVAPRWPILMLIALMLWVSSRSSDVRQSVVCFGTFSDWDDLRVEENEVAETPLQQRGNWLSRAIHSVRSLGQRRRLRQTIQREHQEAADASRLDAVLTQLHTSGRESLSAEDLALLDRVSDSLRREREADAQVSD